MERDERAAEAVAHVAHGGVGQLVLELAREAVRLVLEAAADGGPCEIEKLQGQSRAKKGKDSKRKYDSSLLKALHSVFWLQFWLSGLLKLTSGTCCRPIRA